MSLEEIGDKIIADAEKDVERELSQARARADDIRARAKEDGEHIKEGIMREAEREARIEQQKILAVGTMEPKRNLLRAKDELILETIERVHDNLEAFTRGKEYKGLLLSWIKKGAEDLPGPDIEILLPERDRKNGVLSENDLKQVENGLGTKHLTLSSEGRAIIGGIVLRCGEVEVNASFDALLELRMDELRSKIAKELFS
ncbi:MAG: V-type ATP synthase subunit E family protein [Methanopyri archaeon]|nr:V-type ATP synthase subunit E family protein [Methanopyri archaeon]